MKELLMCNEAMSSSLEYLTHVANKNIYHNSEYEITCFNRHDHNIEYHNVVMNIIAEFKYIRNIYSQYCFIIITPIILVSNKMFITLRILGLVTENGIVYKTKEVEDILNNE